MRDDALDGWLEAHVQHAIALIEDEHFDAIELDQLAIEEVFEAAGRRDDETHTATKRIELRAFGESADDQRDAHVALGHELAVDLFNLHGELARGQQDECGDLLALHLLQTLDDGQHEAEGFAGAGLRGSQNVAAFERGRDS